MMTHGAGWVGMLCYSLFAGIPIIIVGFLGVEIQKRIPRVYSFSDYVQKVPPSPDPLAFVSPIRRILQLSDRRSVMVANSGVICIICILTVSSASSLEAKFWATHRLEGTMKRKSTRVQQKLMHSCLTSSHGPCSLKGSNP